MTSAGQVGWRTQGELCQTVYGLLLSHSTALATKSNNAQHCGSNKSLPKSLLLAEVSETLDSCTSETRQNVVFFHPSFKGTLHWLTVCSDRNLVNFLLVIIHAKLTVGIFVRSVLFSSNRQYTNCTDVSCKLARTDCVHVCVLVQLLNKLFFPFVFVCLWTLGICANATSYSWDAVS